ncbi:UPF0126 domain-containing protein [Geodermatophilus africanus]|uniref:UPF0126 domain-containing protein n=1 Tax=Geodermatophilus africanus TaxID=1137993 RepID=A0A1H3MH40_9ACTN|nr:TRIC cation channel family protein [Geodermatophilus africanus]SDY76000.1 UPF0126 domain-containing protein [Geodermatophilus africanus]
MTTEDSVLLALDLVGTFAFAHNGALTALRVARLDIVGVVTLGMITALGGGIIRDALLDVHGPATAVGAAALCFLIRMVGVRYDLGAPMPRRAPDTGPGDAGSR